MCEPSAAYACSHCRLLNRSSPGFGLKVLHSLKALCAADVPCLAQADLLEHLELGVQVPGRVLAHGDVQEAAARLAAAMRRVSTSPRLRASAQCMRDKLQREDGVAVAAAIIQDSAAVPQPSANLHPAQPGQAEAARHEMTKHIGQVS